MKVFRTVADLASWVDNQYAAKRTIGFVPTMGALHAGHIAVAIKAKAENDVVVVSVFVNPIQFNNPNDLSRYPRTFESDNLMLTEAGVDVMFFPSVDEIYPVVRTVTFDMDGLDAYMEGPNRPGHFNGVVQVVTRLFDIVRPTQAYFGEKDFQQLAIIRHMTKKLGYAVNVVGCETVREESGLAMSSRNALLTPQNRVLAIHIHRIMSEAKEALQVDGVRKNERVSNTKTNCYWFSPRIRGISKSSYSCTC
jgi:pantoate--beta-alanine ligase